jgi:hypothetical protein
MKSTVSSLKPYFLKKQTGTDNYFCAERDNSKDRKYPFTTYGRLKDKDSSYITSNKRSKNLN